jgi:hypothetical protein
VKNAVAVMLIFLYPVYSTCIGMKPVETQFIGYPEKDQQGAYKSCRKPDQVHERDGEMAEHISPRNEQIIFEHGSV